MATDIILENNFISMVGGRVDVEKSLNVDGQLNVKKKMTVGGPGGSSITDKKITAENCHARNKVQAKQIVTQSANISKLKIVPTVGEGSSVPGKITIGTTTLTKEEIRCKKMSAGFFEGLKAKLVKLEVTGTITAQKVTELSDSRCKQEINDLSNSLDKIIGLQGVSFRWAENELNDANPSKDKQLGFLAQDVEKILPEVVTKDSNGRRSLAYTSIIPLLVEGIKTQQKDIQSQNKKIESITKENESLQKRISMLESRLNDLLVRG